MVLRQIGVRAQFAGASRLAERLEPDAVGVPLGDLEQRLDQRVGQQVRLQAEVDQLGVLDVVVVNVITARRIMSSGTASASALATNVHRVGHAALGFGRPQRCWRSLRMRARSRRWAARTSGWRAWALRQRR